MLGAIIGDIVGSRFEFNNHLSTDFELFHKDCSFTDDTICTVAVAQWAMRNIPNVLRKNSLAEIMRYWCQKYPNPMGGYGGNFKQWVKGYVKGPYNSFGNGSAMRVSPVALFHNDWIVMNRMAEASAAITHNHPEGIKGAQAVARAIYLLKQKCDKGELKRHLTDAFGYRFDKSCAVISSTNEFNETCQVTVPQAIQCFIESTDFESAIRLAVYIGGDTDTIAAITGSLAEACYGIPPHMVMGAMEYLPDEMIDVINTFYRTIS